MPDGGDVVEVLAAGEGDQGALGQMRAGLTVLAGAQVVAGVDRGGGELPVWLLCDPLRGRQVSPVSVLVSLGGEVAHGLEGVAAITKVLDPVGDEFQFARLDLGAVLLLA